jgi:hypothetical protein
MGCAVAEPGLLAEKQERTKIKRRGKGPDHEKRERNCQTDLLAADQRFVATPTDKTAFAALPITVVPGTIVAVVV